MLVQKLSDGGEVDVDLRNLGVWFPLGQPIGDSDWRVLRPSWILNAPTYCQPQAASAARSPRLAPPRGTVACLAEVASGEMRLLRADSRLLAVGLADGIRAAIGDALEAGAVLGALGAVCSTVTMASGTEGRQGIA